MFQSWGSTTWSSKQSAKSALLKWVLPKWPEKSILNLKPLFSSWYYLDCETFCTFPLFENNWQILSECVLQYSTYLYLGHLIFHCFKVLWMEGLCYINSQKSKVLSRWFVKGSSARILLPWGLCGLFFCCSEYRTFPFYIRASKGYILQIAWSDWNIDS